MKAKKFCFLLIYVVLRVAFSIYTKVYKPLFKVVLQIIESTKQIRLFLLVNDANEQLYY